MSAAAYVHGEDRAEQDRLAQLNQITNAPFLDFLPLEPGMSVLEIGSGQGILTNLVDERIHPGHVVGIEYAWSQIAAGRRHGPLRCRTINGDAHRLPLLDNSFDLVYCRYVLEHLHHPDAALLDAKRILRPGGRFCVQENDTILTVFDPDCPTADLVIKQFIQYQSMLGGDGRIGKRLFGLLKAAGFKDVKLSIQPEIHTADMPSFPLWVGNLAAIIRGASAGMISNQLVSERDIEQAISELRELIDRPDGSALFHWNRACGIK